MKLVSDIQRVIETLDLSARACMRNNNHDKADAYNSAIYLLKELIPSEDDSSRVSGNAQATEAEQNAEQKDRG